MPTTFKINEIIKGVDNKIVQWQKILDGAWNHWVSKFHKKDENLNRINTSQTLRRKTCSSFTIENNQITRRSSSKDNLTKRQWDTKISKIILKSALSQKEFGEPDKRVCLNFKQKNTTYPLALVKREPNHRRVQFGTNQTWQTARRKQLTEAKNDSKRWISLVKYENENENGVIVKRHKRSAKQKH